MSLLLSKQNLGTYTQNINQYSTRVVAKSERKDNVEQFVLWYSYTKQAKKNNDKAKHIMLP